MADREFVSTTGTRHRLEPQRWTKLTDAAITGCGQFADLSNPVVQQPVKDCKRCYPKGRTE
jgi:hypothetical protein